MNIDLTFDSSTNSAPSAFFTAMNAVAQFFDSVFTNPITVNITVGYGKIDGQALVSGALGESQTLFNQYTYGEIRGALISSASTFNQNQAANSLPASDPTNGGNYWVATGEAKAIGLSGPSSATDGFVGFARTGVTWTYNTTNGGAVAPGSYDFFGVAAHEISEVLGRDVFVGDQDGQGIGANSYTPLDLFHYSSNGVRDFLGTKPGYFSIDGGKTNLDNFNTDSSGDFGDWANSAGNDAFLAFSSSGVANSVTATDIAVLAALGYDGTTVATTPGNIGLAANFAGNGFADIIWEDTSGNATIWTNSAGTIPTSATSFSVPPTWQVVATGDFNADGKSDIVWQSSDTTPGIWLMNGTTPIAEAAFAPPAGGWRIAATGVFDASGRSALVWQSGAVVGVWLMNGTAPVAEAAFASPGPNWNVVGTADLNNDGRDEILLQNTTTGNLTIDFMNGTNLVSSSTITAGDPSWHMVATGREKGEAALFWQNNNGQAGVWLMNGATPVAETGLPNPGADWKIISAGDFNHDGNSDLLFRSAGANQSAIWLMNGTQVQAESQPQASAAAPSSSAAATPLSPVPVLSERDVYYPTAVASSAPVTGLASLGQLQLATSSGDAPASLHLAQA